MSDIERADATALFRQVVIDNVVDGIVTNAKAMAIVMMLEKRYYTSQPTISDPRIASLAEPELVDAVVVDALTLSLLEKAFAKAKSENSPASLVEAAILQMTR